MSTLLTLVQPGTPWRGKYKACRGCGTTQQPALIDGHCADCFAAAFGTLGLDDVPPLGESVMATMTDDLPKIFQETRRLCFSCDQDKGEEEFSATQFYKKRPVCLSCEGHTSPLPIVPNPPPPAAAPSTIDSLPRKRCARCRTHKGESGFSASM